MCGNWIAQVLVENHTIEKKEQEIYTYIFDYIISNAIYAFSLVLIGVLCGRLDVTICYLLVAMPLRWVAGGYHANTRGMCNVLSYGVFLLVVFATPYIADWFRMGWLVLYGMGCAVILAVAPVDTPNKRFSCEQRKQLHRRCVILCAGLSVVEGCFWFGEKNLYYAAISICVIIELIGLVAGIAKNRRVL